MKNDRLYLSVKNKICEMIYKGIYKEGENIPPERTLAESLNVSRVTLRKSLKLLEDEGIIERIQGSGTVVRLLKTGYEGSMDIIALIAPAQRPFFSSFIDYFQKNAEKYDSLVLFKQNTQGEKVEDSLFKLFQKNIRNVVLWLEDLKVDNEYIRRLRGLGMNIVFFDITLPSPYADCVYLDNQGAISSLYKLLRDKGIKNIFYAGWDNPGLSSVKERESSFIELNSNNSSLYHVPWKEKQCLPSFMERLGKKIESSGDLPEGIICGDGEIGITLKKSFAQVGLGDIPVVSVDDFPEAKELSLSVYMQCFDNLAQRVYECLLNQNTNSRQWKADTYPVKGKLIER